MKNILFLLLILFFISCVSGDKNKSSISINNKQFIWDLQNQKTFENDKIRIGLIVNEKNSNIIKNIYFKYVVDSDESAINFLLTHYFFGLLTISNLTDRTIDVKLKSISLINDHKSIKILSAKQVPNDIKRFNPKGLTKNVYNSIWSSVAIVISIKGGDLILDGLGKLYEFISGNRYPDPEDFFSSLYHETNIKYNSLIFDDNKIDKKTTISGLVFINKEELTNTSDITLIYE
jgi:hypothetical protein